MRLCPYDFNASAAINARFITTILLQSICFDEGIRVPIVIVLLYTEHVIVCVFRSGVT